MCKDFLLSEHSSLREEVIGLTKEISALQRNALYLSGALWAWFASQATPAEPAFILYLPTVLSALIFLRTITIDALIGNIDNYLLKMKEKVGVPDSLGWEKYLKNISKPFRSVWNIIYWSFLIAGNAILANFM